jgi:hypothetical protein
LIPSAIEHLMSDRPASEAPRRFSPGHVLKAVLAAMVVCGAGMLLLGLPGAFVLELIGGLGLVGTLPPDAAWPLAIEITAAQAALIVPASLVLRYARPEISGWAHAWRAGLLAFAGTLLVAVLLARLAIGQGA